MKHDDERERETAACSETASQSKRRRTGAGRASMRHEFMELFRDTRLEPSGGASAGAAAPKRPDALEDAGAAQGPVSVQEPRWQPESRAVPAAAAGPSRFLRRFLQQAAPAPEPARSGLTALDRCLGGGFGYGLHLVAGAAGSGKTAFLESLAWENVGNHRPCLYYALRPGGLDVWERLIATLGALLDGPGIAPAALRGRDLVPEDVETLSRLDAALQASVLPYLSIVDAAPGSISSLSAFVEGVRSHSQEAAEEHGRLPVVLVDDLDALLTLTGSRSPLNVLSRLDTALATDSIPGLLAAGPGSIFPVAVDRLPVRTVIALSPVAAGPGGVSGHVDLEVRRNSATGWTGAVPLLLDPLSGFFAEAAPAG